jgi:hypothetical protein
VKGAIPVFAVYFDEIIDTTDAIRGQAMTEKGDGRRRKYQPLICAKKAAVLFCFVYFVLVTPSVFAQEILRVITVPSVCIYISPMETGTTEEQKYFMENMRLEFTGATYEVVDSIEKSDYNVILSVMRDDDTNVVTLTLFDTKTGRELITLGRDYQELSDMDTWNLYLINQAMSNLPLVKILPGTELTAVREGGEEEAEEPEKPPYKSGFYMGMRVGGFLNTSFFQPFGGYDGGRISQGFAGEAAVLMEFRFLPFLSLQTEAIFIYDTFKAANKRQGETELVGSIDTFWHLSLMFPLFIKLPMELDRFTLSPFVGVYYIMLMEQINCVEEDSDKEPDTYPYNINLPVGVSLGIDMGVILGAGELFIGLRFDQNLGMTTVENLGGMQYSRNRIGLSLGYEFLLGQKRR